MAPLALLLTTLLAAGAPPAVEPPPPPVGEVTVIGSREPPKVVRTYPVAGAAPDFGVLVLTVAFDQPMRADSGPPVAGQGAPDCRPGWRLLPDGKTFILLCALKAGEAAHVKLDGFRNAADRLAAPVELAFTGDGDKVDANLEDALKSAGLKPEDGPVMDWAPPSGPGAAASPASPTPAPPSTGKGG